MRATLITSILWLAPLVAVHAQAPPPPASGGRAACTIAGAIVSGGQPLPGVAVTVAIEGQEVARAATGVDGRYTLSVPAATDVAAVRYVLAADLPGFAATTRAR